MHCFRCSQLHVFQKTLCSSFRAASFILSMQHMQHFQGPMVFTGTIFPVKYRLLIWIAQNRIHSSECFVCFKGFLYSFTVFGCFTCLDITYSSTSNSVCRNGLNNSMFSGRSNKVTEVGVHKSFHKKMICTINIAIYYFWISYLLKVLHHVDKQVLELNP